MSKEYHVTTKRTKDAKDSESITLQILNFLLFATFFEKLGLGLPDGRLIQEGHRFSRFLSLDGEG